MDETEKKKLDSYLNAYGNNANNQTEDNEPESKTGFHKLLLLIGFGVSLIVAIAITFNFVIGSYQVEGSSMFPTFEDGDRGVVSLTGKSWASLTRSDYVPKRGEVIIINEPANPDVQFIKRVIALPNERVVVENGKITVFNQEYPDGFNPDETFEADLKKTYGDVDIIVPDAHVFVVGDNRPQGESYDSRAASLGPIPSEYIRGKVVLRFLPVTSFRFF